MKMKHFCMIISALLLISCTQKKQQPELTPWGTVIGGEPSESSAATADGTITLGDIVAQGELIMLTINGPESYYDYHGHGMGLQYLLCEKFAEKIGVKLRVETCKDSLELLRRLNDGDGDIVAYPIAKYYKKAQADTMLADSIRDITAHACGPEWLARSKDIADEIASWYRPEMIAETQKQQKSLLASGGITRHVYAPMINRQKGLISRWDNLFMKHAPTAHLDWRLMAAQCYQESCFDPKAHSWAGACGLMQIMPATARHLGLPADDMYAPEPNIAAAARLMSELQNEFRDVPGAFDRICFALAAYNGGAAHIRDAMALTRKYGKNAQRWEDVKPFVLNLTKPQYYTDPVVKRGYMRGTETSDYVDKIMKRWQDYGGRIPRSASFNGYTGPSTQPAVSGMGGPRPASKKHRYSIGN